MHVYLLAENITTVKDEYNRIEGNITLFEYRT